MNPDATAASLAARLDAEDSTAGARRVLSDLRDVPRSHLEAAALAAVEEQAFDRVRRRSVAEPQEAASVLTAELLPRCLAYERGDPDDPWPSYPELLAGWLNELPLPNRVDVRNHVLASATAALGVDNVPGGLRVIAHVGYADPVCCERLEELVASRDDELGDRALAVRVALGTPPEAAARMRLLLQDRLRRRGGYRLFDVARRIGDAETGDAILAAWRPSLPGVEAWLDAHMALGALAEIASRCGPPSAPRLWRRVVGLAAEAPEENVYHILDSGTIAGFPDPGVISNLLDRLPRDSDRGRWLTYDRLRECVRPSQLPGWDSATRDVLEILRADALAPVDQRGQFKTEEMRQKEGAWEVLLCAGRPEWLPPPDATEGRHASGYVTHAFLELSACLGHPDLPGVVPPLLADLPTDAEWSPEERLAAQVGAVRAAHGAMSDQAFEALRRYRPVRDGILISVIDALADLAAATASRGDRNRVRALLGSVSSGRADPTERSAAGAALARLIEADVLRPDEVVEASGYAADAAADPFTRRALLYALAGRPDAEIPPAVLAAAEAFALSQCPLSDEERRAGVAAAGFLMHASRLWGDALAAFQEKHLGLTWIQGRARVGDPAAVPAVLHHLLGRWYPSDPARYGPAVVDLLGTGDPRRTAALAAAIRRCGAGNTPEVVDALVARARRMDGGREAEPFVLDLLAEVAPGRLAAEEWALVDHWLPQGRAGLADALGRSHGHPRPDECERHLVRLAGDGVFGVRRSAYRAFAGFAPAGFAALVAGWAVARGDAGVELRRRAAEAYRWVSPGDARDRLVPLGWDPDPSVRESFARAAAELREGEWADGYASRVVSAATPDDVVRLWRYGSALSRVGDDRTADRLRLRAGEGVPPCVRFWLDRVRKAVKSRWDDVVRKWPDPWFTRRGRYEVVEAAIRWADGTESQGRVHLWFAAADHPDGFSSWGGWADLRDVNRAATWKRAFGVSARDGEEQLVVPGRRPAEIFITRQFSNGVQVVFSGNSAYPGFES